MGKKDRERPPFPGAPPPIPEADGERDPLVGRELDGRFRIGPRIAVGAMGKIFTAVQEPLGRLVAIKVLSPSYVGELDPEFERRFFLEASAAAGLKHPNTITVHDYGLSEDGLYYIVMELVEGQTLAQLVRSEGALDPLRAVDIVSKIARSLREAHHRGVVHRDLKPENVMVTEFEGDRDWVKVLDFGLVKIFRPGQGQMVDELTNPNLVMGSPRYMSPEQARNKGVEPRSDVYSLGIVLFLLLTGTVPFGRDPKMAAIDIIDGHLNQPAPRPGEIRPGLKLPRNLERLVMRCLAKDPDDRPADMDELLDGLHEAERTLGRGGRGVSRTIRETGGGRWIGALLTLATLVLLGAFGLLGYLILGEPIEHAVDPGSRVLVPITPVRPAADRYLSSGDPSTRPLELSVEEADLPAPDAPGETPRRGSAGEAAEASSETTFIITSSPSGAEVYENGELLGVTPLTLDREVTPEKLARFQVTLWLAGHEPSRISARGAGVDVDPLLLHADLVKLDSPETSKLQPPAPAAAGAIKPLAPAPGAAGTAGSPERAGAPARKAVKPPNSPSAEQPEAAPRPAGGASDDGARTGASAPDGASGEAPPAAGDQKP